MSVLYCCDELIRNYNSQKNVYDLSNRRLQYIMFIAYAMYAKSKGKPLFEDNFQIWSIGPINENSFRAYSKYMYNKFPLYEEENLPEDKKLCIKKAYELTKNMETYQLQKNITVEDCPWKFKEEDRYKEITFEQVYNYYKSDKNFFKIFENGEYDYRNL